MTKHEHKFELVWGAPWYYCFGCETWWTDVLDIEGIE